MMVNINENVIAKRRSVQGFTLIEVMLAMVITAFVAMLAYNGLSAAASAAEQHQIQADRLDAMQLPFTIIERDVRNAVQRSIVDEYGDTVAALTGGSFDDYVLKLTRRGWDNPRGLPRGELQRVRYQLEEEKLWRESWSLLDRLSEEDSQRRTIMLEGVLAVEIAFCDSNTTGASTSPLGCEWVDEWNDDSGLPKALELRVELEDFGEIRRVYGIPSS